MSPDQFLHPADALPNAVITASQTRKIAFLVGSPLSMQERADAPQVPGVNAMLELIREHVPAQFQARFDSDRAHIKSNAYQWAMHFVQGVGDKKVAERVVREAVLRARLDRQRDGAATDDQLDQDYKGWALPPATEHLGKLLVNKADKFGPVLTTNFDPLISASVKMAGGDPHHTIVVDDSPFGHTTLSSSSTHIIHLHGYWHHSPTLHTSVQIARERKRVVAELIQILQDHTLVVVGYGGWADVFTQTLATIDGDRHKDVDILWAFYNKEDDAVVEARYRNLFDKVPNLRGNKGLRCYSGINCHEFFPELRRQFGESIAPQPASPSTVRQPPPPSIPITSTSRAPGPATTPPSSAAKPPEPVPSASDRTASPSVPKTDGTGSPPKSGSRRILPFAAAALIAGGVAAVWPSPSKGVSNDVFVVQTPRNLRPIQPPPPTTTAPVPVPASTLRSVRQQHQVVAASDAERGARVSQLPRGRYAFVPMSAFPTYSANTPIYGPIQEGIELHRALSDGSLYLVGYADAPTITALGYPNPAPIVITPTPSNRRAQVASIPVTRMATAEVRMDKGARVLVLHLN
ncbi:SIR2 family protein [Corallococcus exiguus]|uniref:SIR2 family protein n=1 Tax=Corallococcus exiguus TaxID=83462 RepID=UPI00156112F4|nr:SIR2 family protein [Corallococcus exiguus]NRD61369.1 SIR2 family protein [Corallococcus exiguus]